MNEFINQGKEQKNETEYPDYVREYCLGKCGMGIPRDDGKITCVNTYGCLYGVLDPPESPM